MLASVPCAFDEAASLRRSAWVAVLTDTRQELEKLMGMSGTPTIVFRRTGELLLVSDEFLQLTGHTRTELLAVRQYMWTLMDVREPGDCRNLTSTAIVTRHVLRGLRGACVREFAASACCCDVDRSASASHARPAL